RPCARSAPARLFARLSRSASDQVNAGALSQRRARTKTPIARRIANKAQTATSGRAGTGGIPQLPTVETGLLSSVTAPVRANKAPELAATVFKVMVATARMFTLQGGFVTM